MNDVQEPDLETVDPIFLEKLLPFLDLYAKYFDAEVRGLENVPREGGVLLVGNHSGGTLVPDTAAFIRAWYREWGMDRPLVGLALDAMFAIPAVAKFMRSVGEIPANHENAGRALDAGAAVFVYPGGAYDVFRPWTQRNRIEFAGHKGFIRLALRHRVPVVPVVGHGGHNSTVVLARGDALADRLGLREKGFQVFPLLWQFPWGISIPMIPGIPLPAKITMQVLPAMDWSSLGPEAADDEAIVERCYEEITGCMQDELSALARETPFPLARRLWDILPRAIRGDR